MKKNSSPQTEAVRMKSLACAPGIIFLLVASADGEIDKKKLKRFAKLMASNDYAVLASMLEQAGATISELLDEVLTNNLDPYQELQSVCNILDVYLSEQAAQAYKLTLLRLAKGIAKSSNGLFGFFETEISSDERTAIAVVANLLGLLDSAEKESLDSDETNLSTPLNGCYSSVSELPDILFPALKSADWAKKANSDMFLKCLYEHDESVLNEPVITYAIDLPEMVEFLSSNSVSEMLTVEQIHTKAMQNLEHRLNHQAKWKPLDFDTGIDEVGKVSGLVMSGDYYCSEAILSKKLLNQAHQQLKTEELMAIAPVRGELYVTKLVNENKPELDRLMFAHFAVSRYFKPQQVQISPNVWIIRKGTIAGYVAGMDEIIAGAKNSALKTRPEESKQLIHTAKTYTEDQGVGLEIVVIAKDIEMMMSNLQHVILSYVDQHIYQESFTGKLRVSLDIQDPVYNPAMKSYVSEQLASMSDFLCHHYSSLGIKTVNNSDIKLSCSVIN
jgi:hypothetical protein